MQDENILRKIKKCLRLAGSSNEHEASTALRQAHALMKKHGLRMNDVQTSDIKEHSIRAGAKNRPAQWEAWLASTVAKAFNCRSLHQSMWRRGEWQFIGREAAPEIAGYAFNQLARQARKARQEFIETQCQRLVSRSKTRRADLFCEGWVRQVYSQVQQFAGDTNPDAEIIESYLQNKYEQIGDLKTNNRNQDRKFNQADTNAYRQGQREGEKAKLHHGIGGHAGDKQLALT
ncbi:DUF2786 domain-containing protein [Chromobacterium alkanivorans]|uniref:DUF2786 domain-containing protein n=1 Tax=Chromobacterium alkanivorans TaxID=1071719 RepID=UPI0019676209|nr:DUF2786 domain-containing protein [Chromobacterium alkanivorans]MBN3004482.1 DUF2786 domain-containing protein [Chromobacterium alkanivorans]